MLSITEAIVSYAVSAKADSSAWGTLVREISNLYAQCANLDVLKNTIKDYETAYKKEYAEPQLPPAYRSAKSVALKAIDCGVRLRDDEGNVIGKSAVEKAIKDTKEDKADVPKNINDAWNKFFDVWMGDVDGDRDYVVSCMEGIVSAYRKA